MSRLTDLGLLIHAYSDLSPYPEGYMVANPKTAHGNTRKGQEDYFSEDEILCDAPPVFLYPYEGAWMVKVHEWVPGPGVGDFKISFVQLSEAISSVIDYYFGDPVRMNPPELLELLGE